MWARDQNSVVAEITQRSPAGRFHPSIVWRLVPEAWRAVLVVGCRIQDGTFLPPAKPADPDGLIWLRQRAVSLIHARASEARAVIAGTRDQTEIASWGQKYTAAKAIIADTADSAQIAAIGAEATRRGQTPAELAARIVEKNDFHTLATGEIDGWRQAAETAVLADGLTAGQIVNTLQTLKSQAEADLAALLATQP